MVENHKMIVENSGLLTVAALKHLDVKGKKIVSILSGGNMDVITMSSVIQNGLIQRDRIFTVSVLLPDKPGELVRVSQVIANENGNVIKLDHNQFFTTNRSAAVELHNGGIRHRSQESYRQSTGRGRLYTEDCKTESVRIKIAEKILKKGKIKIRGDPKKNFL